jgi:MraZ protein
MYTLWCRVEESGGKIAMFYGQYLHTIDRKDRLIIPAKFRQQLADGYIEKLYITTGLDKCLFVFPEEEWKIQEQKFKNMPFTKSDSRKFNRLFFSGAQEVTFDKQGRILVPQFLKNYAQIKKNVIILGISNRFEIWDKDTWNEYYGQTKDLFEEIAEDLIKPSDEAK